MNNSDIYANPRLLAQLTQTECDWLTYQEQMERLKVLRKPKAIQLHPTPPAGFLSKRD